MISFLIVTPSRFVVAVNKSLAEAERTLRDRNAGERIVTWLSGETPSVGDRIPALDKTRREHNCSGPGCPTCDGWML